MASPKSLTFLAKIKPNEEDALAKMLADIGNDINGRYTQRNPTAKTPHVHFTKSPHTHFARFVILDDPDSGAKRKRLLFSAIYDGSLKRYIDEFISITHDMDSLWGKCEGYSGKADFADFVKACRIVPQTYYVGFHDESVARVRGYISKREKLDLFLNHLDQKQLDELNSLPEISPLRRWVTLAFARLIALVLWLPNLPSFIWDGLRLIFSYTPFELYNALQGVKAKREPPRYTELNVNNCEPCSTTYQHAVSSADVREEFRVGEDVIAQNQMNILSQNEPALLRKMKTRLAVINFAAKYLGQPGLLSGISTIHFASWTIIDDGKRLLFQSNYDGSWENYIGDFVDKAASGLDAIWENCIGYPKGGSRDIAAFKRVIRCHQVQSDVFYSAYPFETVLNRLNDRQIGKAFGKKIDLNAVKRWLQMQDK